VGDWLQWWKERQRWRKKGKRRRNERNEEYRKSIKEKRQRNKTIVKGIPANLASVSV
jgi:hypothetical protein